MKVQNQASKVSFASKVKLIPQDLFTKKVANLNPKRHKVGYPWTVESGKSGKNLFTTDIMNCICVAILGKSKADLFHIRSYAQPTSTKCRQSGFDIKNIERRIMDKIDLANENLHAFILGGFQLDELAKWNVVHLNKIKNIFDKNKIPYSVIGARKDVHYFGEYSFFYNNKEDTVYIASALTNYPKLKGKGKELLIDGNKVTYITYKKIMENGWATYLPKTQTGTQEDFLNSQFRQVALCKFDEFV